MKTYFTDDVFGVFFSSTCIQSTQVISEKCLFSILFWSDWVMWCDGGHKVHSVSSVKGSEAQTPNRRSVSFKCQSITSYSGLQRQPENLAVSAAIPSPRCSLSAYSVCVELFIPAEMWLEKHTAHRACRLTFSACNLLHINTLELFLGFAKPLQTSVGHWKRYIRGCMAQTNWDSYALLQRGKVGNFWKFIPRWCWILIYDHFYSNTLHGDVCSGIFFLLAI